MDELPIWLWSMTWKDVENVIMVKDGILWSIDVNSLANAVIVYHKDEDILDKFNNLKKQAPEGALNRIEFM